MITQHDGMKLKTKILKARKSRHENQAVFWKRLGVTQSGGSRYENMDPEHARNIPASVAILFDLVYGPKPIAKLAKLRGTTVDELVVAE